MDNHGSKVRGGIVRIEGANCPKFESGVRIEGEAQEEALVSCSSMGGLSESVLKIFRKVRSLKMDHSKLCVLWTEIGQHERESEFYSE